MRTRIILGTLAVAVWGVTTYAKDAAQKSSDEEVIRKAADEYCAAFNDGKVDAVIEYWGDDADYVDEDGQAYHGKDAVRELFKRSLESLKGSKLNLKIENLHLIKPDVAIEDGTASLTGPDGETSKGRYTAVWTKSGDHWRIASAHDLPMKEQSAPEANADYLKPLDWLIGDWTSDDKERPVKLTSRWALDKNYIVQDYLVPGEGGDDLKVTQWIGFDPISGQIKSRAFDSRGGYGEGLWERDDNTWTSEAIGVLPDGRTGSAQNSVQFVDESHMGWRSTGRNVDGQPMPDVEVKFVRAGKGDQDSKSAKDSNR